MGTLDDYYGVLGVGRRASPDEIRRAYRRLARRHHPDISDQAGAAGYFHAVSEAYQVLGNPRQRAPLRRPPAEGGRRAGRS